MGVVVVLCTFFSSRHPQPFNHVEPCDLTIAQLLCMTVNPDKFVFYVSPFVIIL